MMSVDAVMWEFMPLSGVQGIMPSGGENLLLPCSGAAWCHLVPLLDVLPHTLSLGLDIKAKLYAAQQHQPQVIADVVVHQHMIPNQVHA